MKPFTIDRHSEARQRIAAEAAAVAARLKLLDTLTKRHDPEIQLRSEPIKEASKP